MDIYLNYDKRTEDVETYWGENQRSEYRNITLGPKDLGYDSDRLTVQGYPEGTELWGLYCVYTQGDTFHTHECGGIELLFVSPKYEDVIFVQKTLEASDKDAYSVTVVVGGKEYQFYCPWKGYFESLEYMDTVLGRV